MWAPGKPVSYELQNGLLGIPLKSPGPRSSSGFETEPQFLSSSDMNSVFLWRFHRGVRLHFCGDLSHASWSWKSSVSLPVGVTWDWLLSLEGDHRSVKPAIVVGAIHRMTVSQCREAHIFDYIRTWVPLKWWHHPWSTSWIVLTEDHHLLSDIMPIPFPSKQGK